MATSQYLLTLLICWSLQTTGKELHKNLTSHSWSNVAQSVPTAAPTSKAYFGSRLEYSNKWLPVGRGDPVHTFDYIPPAVDHRVHYWDEKSTKTNGNKNEILLLGVSSRRQYHNNNYDRKPNDIREHISTVMLPPPIQPVQMMNFQNNEKSPNRQSTFGTYNLWQDTIPAESNVQPTVVLPNTMYHHQLNANADDMNGLLSHSDYHSPMYIKSNAKKSWLQDQLQKEVKKPVMPPTSHFHMETINMVKLDDMNHFNSKMPVMESVPEIAPTYFVPTINPSYAGDNKVLLEEIPKPMTPMNLNIQSHSRVKTYGQGTEQKVPKIIDVKSSENPVVNRVVSKDENGIQFDVKHLHASSSSKTVNASSLNVTAESEKSPVVGLLSLLDLSFGNIFDNSSDVVNKTKANEIKVL